MYGAVNTWLRSALNMEPHSGVGGCAPRPRKDRAAASRMAVAIPNVPKTISGVSEFGRMRPNKIYKVLPPKAREAATKSISRVVRIAERVTRAYAGMDTIP